MICNRLLAGLVTSLTVTAGFAVVPPEDAGPVQQREFRHPDLDYGNVFRSVAELRADVSRSLVPGLGSLGVDPGNAYFDLRTGRWGTLIVTRPLIPGSGVGNTLQWSTLGCPTPRDTQERKQAAWEAFRSYLVDHAATLRIDPSDLGEPTVSVLGNRVIQIHVGQQRDGIPVRGAFVKAAINSGNLVLMGERKWGDLELETRPGVSSDRAEQSLRQHLDGFAVAGFRKAPRLEILPVSSQPYETLEMLGDGLEHRLAWVLTPTFEGDRGTWEALVDAHSGELLAFQDTNHYASRRVGGWIYPVSNDQQPPDGELREGYPMPFADITVDGEDIGFTSTGGNVPSGAAAGTISTALSGRYIQMADQCGAIDESTESGDLDLEGMVGGTDCEVPSGHSPGDTNASRSGFYELNRLKEQARGYLPDNAWLDQQLTANMNINQNCNAFWNGSTINFYTSGGGCGNTGEIAAVFDHEWGHGMDHNDGNPTISQPGEGIADIYAQNRLNDSCVGRGFRPGENCTGFGDVCLDCTGVRDTDWEKHASGQPHDIDWILSSGPPNGGCGAPGSPSGGTPCGGGTHCEGHVVSESAWDLVHRDLMGFEGSPFDLDLNTALELGTRLSYYGSSNVGSWYQCVTDGTGGCNADGGYLGYLAADDDDGDLTNGTPHMSAIFAAFDRHQLACPTPTVQDSGCAGGPATAPENFATAPFHEGVQLTWDPVPGASEYWVFRTEGVHGCNFGKAKVGETTTTHFTDTGLRNGFEVLYSVVAVGESEACTSPMSACQAVTPIPGPGLSFDPSPLAWEEQNGDGDGFLDNCETGTLTFQVRNTGVGALTNVRIIEVSVPSHPEVEILTELPTTIAGSLAAGDGAGGEVLVVGRGLAFNDVLELEVTVTSDELEPLTFTRTYTLSALESDLEPQPSVTYTFEDGMDSWQLVSGIFDRTDTGGGADGTSFYRASSTGLDQQCDRIRSPLLQLAETSTLELYNQFDIEPQGDGLWWDRANVGVFDPAAGERTLVSPDGGRGYTFENGTNPAPAPCASHDPPELPGWAASGPNWEASTWSADALGSPELAGQLIQLDVAYGTDPAVTGAFGFWFDELTVTDVGVQVPDGQFDVCAGFEPAALDVDASGNGVFEPGESVVVAPTWQNISALSGSLAGSGEGFSGPSTGSLYTIVDGTADYGNVEPEQEASCAVTGDCYQLSVFDVSTRPVQHWDATFDEMTSTETQKIWTLHIGDSFVDVPQTSPFYPAIEALLHSGVTEGCTSTEYCPTGPNTRAQMPVFVLKALEGPDFVPPSCAEGDEVFGDVSFDSPFCPWITELAVRNVIAGCAGGNYCPNAPVTRAQMAIFLLKTFEGADYTPPECTGAFADVTCPSLFADWIEELAAREITGGCSTEPLEYCPAAAVTRAQMAVFIIKPFGLTLYGP